MTDKKRTSQQTKTKQRPRGGLSQHILRSYIRPEEDKSEPSEQSHVFTTEGTRFRIRRGHTIIIRRCKAIMRLLWQTNHRQIASEEEIDQAIFYCAGGDFRTLGRYRGFYSNRSMKSVDGYLQRLRYIEKAKGRTKNGCPLYFVNHQTLPYYTRQAVFSPFQSPTRGDRPHIQSKNVCVQERAEGNHEVTLEQSPSIEKQTNNNNYTHTNQSSESIDRKSVV